MIVHSLFFTDTIQMHDFSTLMDVSRTCEHYVLIQVQMTLVSVHFSFYYQDLTIYLFLFPLNHVRECWSLFQS